MKTYDHIIVGAGIVGLAIAFKLKKNNPNCTILILEKESFAGAHASGRNSGVLHSGIYYKSGSLKAKLCASGSKEMAEFCQEYRLPIKAVGKIIVGDENSQELINILQSRATQNGADTEIVSGKQLRDIEPELSPLLTIALYSPNTAVVDPSKILLKLTELLTSRGVDIKFSHPFKHIDISRSTIYTNKNNYGYGSFYNAAGLYADKIAHACDVGHEFKILPFKGNYFSVKSNVDVCCNGLVYPVPDLRYPFLGIHITKSIHNEIFVGPSAIPALGRENYTSFKGINLIDATNILGSLINAYWHDYDNFRNLAKHELKNSLKKNIIMEAQKLLPRIDGYHFNKTKKVGIRAQLYNKVENKLEMDFLVRENKNTTHILNAVSPGFTSAFTFADYIVNP